MTPAGGAAVAAAAEDGGRRRGQAPTQAVVCVQRWRGPVARAGPAGACGVRNPTHRYVGSSGSIDASACSGSRETPRRAPEVVTRERGGLGQHRQRVVQHVPSPASYFPRSPRPSAVLLVVVVGSPEGAHVPVGEPTAAAGRTGTAACSAARPRRAGCRARGTARRPADSTRRMSAQHGVRVDDVLVDVVEHRHVHRPPSASGKATHPAAQTNRHPLAEPGLRHPPGPARRCPRRR